MHLGDKFKQALEDAERFGAPVFASWQEADRALALQLREASRPDKARRALEGLLANWKVVELWSGLRDFELAAKHAGASYRRSNADGKESESLRKTIVVATLGFQGLATEGKKVIDWCGARREGEARGGGKGSGSSSRRGARSLEEGSG